MVFVILLSIFALTTAPIRAHYRAYPRSLPRLSALTAAPIRAHCRTYPRSLPRLSALTASHCLSLPLTASHCLSPPLPAAHCRSPPLIECTNIYGRMTKAQLICYGRLIALYVYQRLREIDSLYLVNSYTLHYRSWSQQVVFSYLYY